MLFLTWRTVDRRSSTRHTGPYRHGWGLGTDLGEYDTTPRGSLAAVGDGLGEQVGDFGSVNNLGSVFLEWRGRRGIRLSSGEDKVGKEVNKEWSVGCQCSQDE